ncbi:MAG: hypothetical protein ACHP78_09945 [Terriglobales bacterium]
MKTENKSPRKFPYTVFLDRTHGKAMAALLRKVGFEVRSIRQVYPKKKHENVKDPEWIVRCAKEGWIAISGDKKLRNNVVNRQAVIDAKGKVFILTDTNSLPEEWAAAVIVGRTKIETVARKNEGPFFATIARESRSHVSHAKFPGQEERERKAKEVGTGNGEQEQTRASHPPEVRGSGGRVPEGEAATKAEEEGRKG